MVTNRQINRDKLHLIAGIPTLKNMSQIESSSQLLGKIWQPCSTSPTRQNIGYYKFPLFSLMPINDHHPTIGTMISMIGSSNYWIYIYHHPTIGYIHPTIYNDHPLYIYMENQPLVDHIPWTIHVPNHQPIQLRPASAPPCWSPSRSRALATDRYPNPETTRLDGANVTVGNGDLNR